MSDIKNQNSKAARDHGAPRGIASPSQPSSEPSGQNSRPAMDALREGGQAAAEIGARAGESGAEVLRRSTDALAQSQRQIAQEAAERLQVVSRGMAETSRDTAEDVRTLMSLPSVADRGLRDFQHTVTGLVDALVQTNLRATEELFRITNPISLFELQQRFVAEHMSVMMESSAALVRAVRQTVDQSLPALEQRLDERQHARADHPAQSPRAFQTAAE